MEKCASNKACATAMAIGGRALRPCDVCGRERAKWYCKADEAYLCEHCDGSVHGANTVSLRHERLRVSPSGLLMKNFKRPSSLQQQQAADDASLVPATPKVLPPAAAFSGSRKRPRSNRSSATRVKTEPNSTRSDDKHDLFTTSLLSDDIIIDDGLYDAKVFLEEPLHEVPIFADDPGKDEDILAYAAVPCASPGNERNNAPESNSSPEIEIGDDLCFDHFLDSHPQAGFCDMEAIMISGALDIEGMSTELGVVLGDNGREFCSGNGREFCSGNEFTSPVENSNTSEGEESSPASAKVKQEEPDELDKIKMEVDEMLGLAFGSTSIKEEEIVERKGVKLKLNYEDVLNAWSGRGPFWTEGPRPQTVPDDSFLDPANTWAIHDIGMECVHSTETIGQVPVVNFGEDKLCSGGGGGREARVMRYKEKRRTRLFSKKIRYEVRKSFLLCAGALCKKNSDVTKLNEFNKKLRTRYGVVEHQCTYVPLLSEIEVPSICIDS